MTQKERDIKSKIIDFLNSNNLLEQVDDEILDEYIFNMWIMRKAKLDIRKRGLSVNTAKEGNKAYYNTNPSISIYDGAFKRHRALSSDLGLTPDARAKIFKKIVEPEKNNQDDVDEILDE